MFKSIIGFLAKIFFALFCLVIVSRSVNFSEVVGIFSDVNYKFLILSYILILLESWLMAARLKILFESKEIFVKFNNFVRVIFVSLFVGSAIPSSIGADALRIILLKKQNLGLTHSTSVMIMDRAISVFAMLTFSLVGLLFMYDHIQDANVILMVFALLVLSSILFLCALSRFPQMIFGQISGFCVYLLSRFGTKRAVFFDWLKKAVNLVSGIHVSFADFSHHPRGLLKVFAWNALNQVLRVLQVHCIFLAIGYAIHIQYELAFVPIIMLLTLLPITYFGIGIREGAFLYFFSLVGIPEAVSLSASMLLSMLIICGILPGIILFFHTPKE